MGSMEIAAEWYVVLDCCTGKREVMMLLGLSKFGELKSSGDAVSELGLLLLNDSGCIEFISIGEVPRKEALLDRSSSVGA